MARREVILSSGTVEYRAAAADLGRRPGGAARPARRAGGAGPARRRRQFPRPLCLTFRDAGQAGHRDPERPGPRREPRPADRPLGAEAAEHPGHRALPRPCLLEELRGPRRAGPAMRLHPRQLCRGQGLRAGRLPRRHRGRLAAPAGKPWLGEGPQHQCLRGSRDQPELPLGCDGHQGPSRRHAAAAADAEHAGAGPIHRGRRPCPDPRSNRTTNCWTSPRRTAARPTT